MIAIIIFTVFAIVVAFGVIDLKKSKLSENQKIIILTAVGILLSVSLLISTLKQTRHLTFSLLKTNLNEVETKFTQLPSYNFRYNIVVSEPFNEVFYPSNYPFYNNIIHNRKEKIIFMSKSNQGASTFMYLLAKKLQQKRIPTFYLKLQTQVYNQIDMLQNMDIPSIKTLEDVIETWNLKGTIPYLIIDGIEYLASCQEFLEHLASIFKRLNVNFVGNTEDRRIIQKFFKSMPYQQFIVKEWAPPSQPLLQKVAPNHYFKRLPNNFLTLHQIQSSSEEQILMRYSSSYRQLVNQFGIPELLKEMQGKEIHLSSLKNRMSFEQLSKALQAGLIRISNGIVQVSNPLTK